MSTLVAPNGLRNRQKSRPLPKVLPNATSKAHLSYLPDELLELTFRNAAKASLKCIRQTSKALCKIATPLLFREWTLYPHVQSFTCLSEMCNTPQISSNILSLVFDSRFHDVTSQLIEILPTIFKVQAFDQSTEMDITRRAHILHQGAFTGRQVANHVTQAALLTQAFNQMSKIQHVQIFEPGSRTHKDKLPDFYQQLCKEACTLELNENSTECLRISQSTFKMSYALNVLTAACLLKLSLATLKIEGISWSTFLGSAPISKYPCLYSQLFSELRQLHLTTNDGDYFEMQDIMSDLQAMLKSAVRLETLQLRLRYHDCELLKPKQLLHTQRYMGSTSIFEFPKEKSPEQLPARFTWSPYLTCLELGGLTCTVSDLKNVLRHCSSSLEDLELRDISLVPETDTQACFVHLFNWIRATLDLEKFRPTGFWSNGGMQNWFISGKLSHDSTKQLHGTSLHSLVEDFVVNGGTCPLDSVAVPEGHFDLGIQSRGSTASSFLLEEEYAGDDSWIMMYPSRYFHSIDGGYLSSSDDDELFLI